MKTRLLLCTTVLAIAGCGAPGEFDDENVDETESAYSNLAVTPLSTPISSTLAASGQAVVIKTAAEFRARLRAEPTGVDFSREWVAFLSNGVYAPAIPRIQIRLSTDRTRITAVGTFQRSGSDCVQFPGSGAKYSLVKFARSTATSSQFLYDQTTASCSNRAIDLSCVNGGTRCYGGQMCRLVDGRATCVGQPVTCDFVECGLGTACFVSESNRAECRTVISFPEGLTVTFPTGLVVTIPTSGIPSVCKSVTCGAGKVCTVSSQGTPICVSKTGPGPIN